MSPYAALIPINVLTGFLGAGKTSLLQKWLTAPALANSIVLVNEFGAVGLDHRLLHFVTENVLLLDNGCLCCAVRGDLQAALRDLLSERDCGTLPQLQRVVIETSGMADPVPVAYTLLSDPLLQHHFRLSNILTIIDAVNARQQLQTAPEAVKQVAVADRLIITKSDLAQGDTLSSLRTQLQCINQGAPILDAHQDRLLPEDLLCRDLYAGDPTERLQEVKQWQQAGIAADLAHADHGSSDIRSFSLHLDEAMDWTAFGIWLTMLLHCHGEQILRVKGLLKLQDLSAPVLLNAVQHIVHPPAHLEAWPDEIRQSQLLFITRDLAPDLIRASLQRFLQLP